MYTYTHMEVCLNTYMGKGEQEEDGQRKKRGIGKTIPGLVIVDGNLGMALGQGLEIFLVNSMD